MRLGKPKVASNPIQVQPEKKERPRLRKTTAWAITILLLAMIGIIIFSTLFPDIPALKVPGAVVADAVTPVQGVFSTVTNAVVGYLRTLKLRSNVEYEYNRLVAENEQLAYQAMLADDLQKQLSELKNIDEEMDINAAMNPINCTIIGRTGDNYFSVFTINKGSNDGIQDYMAVVSKGALVGYTYDVKASSSSVRSIIDSQASIPGLIQSSRDQGTVRGTYGDDGQPMCRMYYLSSDQLPRPGDVVVTSGVTMPFPKGIPIGEVRESTRRLDANKQYIVVEPKADFLHLEFVIVLRYQPDPEAVETRGNISAVPSLQPLDTPRPYPPLQVGDTLITFESPSPSPGVSGETPTPEPTPTPASQTPTPPPGNSLEYQVPNSAGDENATLPPDTLTPSPEPTPTFSLDQLTVEGD